MVFFPTGGLLAVVLLTPFAAGFTTGLSGAGAAIILQILWRVSESALSVDLGDEYTSARRVLALTTVISIASYPYIIYKLVKEKKKHYRLDYALYLFPGMNIAVWLGNYAAKEFKQDILTLVLGFFLLSVAIWQWYQQSIANRAIDDEAVRQKAAKATGNTLPIDTTSTPAVPTASPTTTTPTPTLKPAAPVVSFARVRGNGYVDLEDSAEDEPEPEAPAPAPAQWDRSARVRHMSGWARGDDEGDITPSFLTSTGPNNTVNAYNPYNNTSTKTAAATIMSTPAAPSARATVATGAALAVDMDTVDVAEEEAPEAAAAPSRSCGASICASVGGAWRHYRSHQTEAHVGLLAGGAAGFLGGAFGINGPAVLIYLTALGLDSFALRDTCNIVFFMNLPCTIAARFLYSTFAVDEVLMYLSAVPTVLLGLWLGWKLFPHCDTRSILTFLQFIIALSSVPLTNPDAENRWPILVIYVLLGCVVLGFIVWRLIRNCKIRKEYGVVGVSASGPVVEMSTLETVGKSERNATTHGSKNNKPEQGTSLNDLGTSDVSLSRGAVVGIQSTGISSVGMGVAPSPSNRNSGGRMRTMSIGVWGDDSDAESGYGLSNAYGHKYGFGSSDD